MGSLLVARRDEIEAVRLAVAASPPGLVVYGEAGVGKTALVRTALHGLPLREGGSLATLSWAPFMALRRAFGDALAEQAWSGDPEHVAEQVERALGDDVLHIDDVQWADPGTRAVLGMLAGRCRVVATIRRGDPGAPEALEELTGAGLPRLDVEPLDDEAAADLVRRLRPGLTAVETASLVERSGGNPLLIEELADVDADIATLHRALLARCRVLPETQLDDLALLALAGQPLDAATLSDATALVESGIVERDGDRVSIRHALIAEVLDDLFTPERQINTRLRLAELLPHPGQRARHLLAAGRREEAHRAAVEAVAVAADPGERISHLETAAQCLDPVAGAEFRLRAAEQATSVDRAEVAVRLLDGLPDRSDLRFRVARQRFQLASFAGETEALPALADEVSAAAEPGTAEEVLALMDENFSIIANTGDPDRLAQARGIAERAVELSGRIDAERSAALKALGDTMWLSGDDRWREVMPAARTWAVAEGNLAREWRTANNEISALQSFGPIERALELADAMATKFETLRLTKVRRYFEFRRISLLLGLADYQAILETAPRLLTSPGMHAVMEVDLTCILAEAHIHTGDRDTGFALLDGAPTTTERGRVDAHRIRAEAHLDADRADLALAEIEAFDTYDTALMLQTQLAAARAWTARALGLPAPPRPDLLPDTGMFAGVTHELDGIDAVRAEDFIAAAGHFEVAAEKYRDCFTPRWVRCTWFVGEALRQGGDPRAEEVLTRAEAEATRRGMVPIRIQCERSLRAVGVQRSAPVVRSAGSALTDRESEIADLAVAGLTDDDIAARLGLTRRTVQSTLASARRKLGAENRAHLVRMIVENRS